jgi:DNA-binding NarL/FixJ family response regulator
MTRILIADDHEVVRSGMRAILEAHEGWEVVAEAGDGKDAIAKALQTEPAVAIIDYSLPVMNGIEVTRQIKSKLPNTEILIFTMHDSAILIAEVLEAGARAYVLKSEANQYLIAAVQSLAEHKPFFTSNISQHLLNALMTERGGDPKKVLTSRELIVVQLIAEGHSNREMAELLNLSIKTIETRRAEAMRKLGVKSIAGLVRYAIRNRLVEP